MKKIALQAELPVFIFREGKSFIAYTPALDLSTVGKTYQEARKRFREAANIFFEEIVDGGTIEEVLSENGWQRKGSSAWTPPVFVGRELQAITLTT